VATFRMRLGSTTMAIALAGCGHRSVAVDQDASSALTPGGQDGSVGSRPIPPAPDAGSVVSGGKGDRCVMALRTDTCCGSVQASWLSEVEARECLELWPLAPGTAQCLHLWPKGCDLVDCDTAGPPSRVVAPQGGKCAFVDECQGPADCVLAKDYGKCCSCPESRPTVLLGSDPCLVQQPETDDKVYPPPDCAVPDCPEIPCPLCTLPDSAPTCHLGDALNWCGW
jgi:hypothetical protein